MPNLKDLKLRIESVKSTKKITSAMKMVAAAKLKRSQEKAFSSRPYSKRMEGMISSLAKSQKSLPTAPALLRGTGQDKTQLIVVMTSDRGLCGSFNSSIIKRSRSLLRELENDGKNIKLYFIGKKGYNLLKREYADKIVGYKADLGRDRNLVDEIQEIAQDILTRFEKQEFDQCRIIYNKFKSALVQEVTLQQIIPVDTSETSKNDEPQDQNTSTALYDYEPNEELILKDLLPRNISIQLYKALLENAASEHGARMTAMDSATRNADDMIKKLTITYNRTRQAFITKELIEIISGAEAV